MQLSYGRARGLALAAAYLLYITCLTLAITVYRALHPNGWTPGDWLVNYTGGFVRRGLPGEALLLTGHVAHLSPVLLGSLLPFVFYAGLYAAIWQLFRRSSAQLWLLVALVSPATLAFPILDPTGAFRKELLVLLALAWLLLWFLRGRPTDTTLIASLTAVGVLTLLSHEGLLPYLVYLVAALWLGTGDLRRLARILPVPLVATGVTLWAVLHHRGSLAAERAICQSLGPAPALVCHGSIAYLAAGTDLARADVAFNIHAYHYLLYYPVLTILAAVPLVALWRRLARTPALRPGLWALLVCTVVAVLASTPLFLLAMDWGRWIYIHVLSVFLLLLFLDARQETARQRSILQQPLSSGSEASLAGRTLYPGWVSVAILLYALCWNIPHYGNYPKKGYFNTPLHLLKEHWSHKAVDALSTVASASAGPWLPW